MKDYDKVIFVSTGNTAVGPMTEAIMQDKFRLEDILVESRGLVVLFPEPINPKAEAILVRHGLSMKDHTSVPFDRSSFDERTLILTLDSSQKEKLCKEYDDAQNVYTIAEFVGDPEELQDPYGGDLSDYEYCFERLKKMIDQLEIKLKQEGK